MQDIVIDHLIYSINNHFKNTKELKVNHLCINGDTEDVFKAREDIEKEGKIDLLSVLRHTGTSLDIAEYNRHPKNVVFSINMGENSGKSLIVRAIPIYMEFDWQFYFFKGRPQYYQVFHKLAAGMIFGKLDFVMRLKINGVEKPMRVKVASTVYDVVPPETPVNDDEVQVVDPGSSIINLAARNIFEFVSVRESKHIKKFKLYVGDTNGTMLDYAELDHEKLMPEGYSDPSEEELENVTVTV